MHSATLFVQIGGVLLALALLGRLAQRFGLSPIPFYLLGGLAFGEGGLVSLDTSEGFLAVGSEIGVVLLLVMLGLEYSADELVDNLRRAAPAGLVDMLLNALPGVAFALLLGWGPVAAVVLGGVTWVSSSGVIAKILTDLGRLGNRETPSILSILVIEDLAMAFYLPILTAVLVGESLAAGSVTVAVAVVSVLAVLVVATRFSSTISGLVAADHPESLLLGVLGLTMLVAGAAQSLRVSAAVGAFLVGIAISGPVAQHASQLLEPLRDLFAAVFFVFFGLSTDPRAIPPVLLPALLLALVTMSTKVITGYWAAGRARVGVRGRWRAGLSLVARGEFSIVIAGLAVASSTVHPKLAPLATAYVLLTVVAGPALARIPDTAWFRRRFRPAAPST